LKGRSAALESGADLVVTELRGPANVRQWHGFTATVKVCNQGTAPSYNGSFVELLLSTDAALTMPGPNTPPGSSQDQVVIGSVGPSQALYPGQCEIRSVNASATLPPAAQGSGAYYLAAAVDTQHAETELREDNNLFVSGLMGVGYGADLVVRGVKAPASVRGGYGFTATVEVCNQGTTRTQAGSSYPYYDRPRVELFLSMDAELTLPEPGSPSPSIPVDQMSIGVVELDTLDAGQCIKKDVQASSALPPAAQGDGAYYLVAAVDTKRLEQELREDNNVHVSGLMGVGNRPDLVVTEVTGPASARYGQGITGQVKVCNQGTTPTTASYSSGARVDLFLLEDPALSMPAPGQPADPMPIASVNLGQPLYPGQCVTKSVPASAYPPPGAQGDAFYLAAAVDTSHLEQELREDNNVHVSGLVGVGSRSDLVVSAVSAPASVAPGQSFTASVKVCNQGTSRTSGYSSGPRVELFLSTDTELTLPDPYSPSPGPAADQQSLGYVELGQQLEPGQCVTKSVPAYTSLPPQAQVDGAYYVVAAVDTNHSESELREDNNVRVGGLVGVGYRADLVVTQVSGPASAWNGQSFTASVKVCNQGTGSSNGSSGTRVELFLSRDTELTLPDPYYPSPGQPEDQVLIGFVELNQPINPGQCVTRGVSAYANPPPEAQPSPTYQQPAYYLVAAVDTLHAEQELREDNNVHVGGLMGVGYRSDLVVTEVSAPASVWQGQSFTASVKVCNQGTYRTSGGGYYDAKPRVELFLSMDTELTLPTSSWPSPPPPMDQQSIGYAELYQPLEPGQCATVNVSAYASLPPQALDDEAYYLVAAADTNHSQPELREDNNVHVSGLMGVGHRADLVVSAVGAPASVAPGQSFTASVKVCNQGTSRTSGSSYGPRVELLLSMDTELTLPEPYSPAPSPAADQQSLGYVELGQQLEPGHCVTKSMPAYASLPPAAQNQDTFYLAAVVDMNHAEQELREDNNVHVSGLLGVGHRADLVVTELSAPANVKPGDPFTASVEVCNQGTTPTSGTSYGPRVELFLSTDAELTPPAPGQPFPAMTEEQWPIGYVELGQRLYPGQCVTKSVSAYASMPPQTQGEGAYYLAAIVDTNHAEQELREDNNVHVQGRLGVGYRPDLVVTEVSAPASVTQGQSFTASVKVCNQGTTPTSGYYNYGPRVELLLSTDAELTLPDPYSPSPSPAADQQFIGSVQLDQPVHPGQCVTKSVSAYASLPSQAQGEGAYYLAAIADTNHSEMELREDNNVHVHGLMGVGSRSDLVVSALSAPASVTQGQSFTASVKVCNQGTKATDNYYSKPRVELFLSTDAELTLYKPGAPPSPPSAYQEQVILGSVQLDQHLQPGQCVTKDLPAYTSLPPAAQGEGTYHLVAVVDPSYEEYELREDNNVLVSGLLGVGSGADLVVSEVNAPAILRSWQDVPATVKVCNQGTISSPGAARLQVLLSTEAQLTPPRPGTPLPGHQVRIGSLEVAPLGAGQCVTMGLSVHPSPPPESQGYGVYHLGASIDTELWVQELREDNNTRTVGTVELTP
jgi:subtilase family serine protease